MKFNGEQKKKQKDKRPTQKIKKGTAKLTYIGRVMVYKQNGRSISLLLLPL